MLVVALARKCALSQPSGYASNPVNGPIMKALLSAKTGDPFEMGHDRDERTAFREIPQIP